MNRQIARLVSFIKSTVASLTTICLHLITIYCRRRRVSNVVNHLKQKPWTTDQLREAYARLENDPITVESTKDRLPPKLNRRYTITGGNGLVGGYLVLQLLARGQPPESIRIVDDQDMHRQDMLSSAARDIDVVHTDISSVAATDAAFSKPWPESVAKLPLTVFHTADTVDRPHSISEHINFEDTKHVLAAARKAGANVLVYTASGSIAVRKVDFWTAPWRLLGRSKSSVQHLTEADFFHPLRPPSEFCSAYAASKAVAERIVCDANCEHLRTGSIRPATGVYGHPTDNTIGALLRRAVWPSWSRTNVTSFVHGMNCAVAHLDLEAVLADPRSSTTPQAGRPFIVTDPNAPIQLQDLWLALETLSVAKFRTVPMMPVIEGIYGILPRAFPVFKDCFPIMSDLTYLQPTLFTPSHLYATSEAASKSIKEGGIGYSGVINTMDGVVQQVLEWNNGRSGLPQGSVSLAGSGDEKQTLYMRLGV